MFFDFRIHVNTLQVKILEPLKGVRYFRAERNIAVLKAVFDNIGDKFPWEDQIV